MGILGSILGAVAGPIVGKVLGGDKSKGSQTVSRMPSPWEPGAKSIWDKYVHDTLGGGQQALADKYAGVLEGLVGQLARPAYSISIGGQTVPVIPRRNINLLDSLVRAEMGMYNMEADPLQQQQQAALKLDSLRYASPTTTEAASYDPSRSILNDVGMGMGIAREIGRNIGGYTPLGGSVTMPANTDTGIARRYFVPGTTEKPNIIINPYTGEPQVF